MPGDHITEAYYTSGSCHWALLYQGIMSLRFITLVDHVTEAYSTKGSCHWGILQRGIMSLRLITLRIKSQRLITPRIMSVRLIIPGDHITEAYYARGSCHWGLLHWVSLHRGILHQGSHHWDLLQQWIMSLRLITPRDHVTEVYYKGESCHRGFLH